MSKTDDDALLEAVSSENPTKAKAALVSGASPDLHSGNWTVLMDAISCEDETIVKLLLEFKANPNSQGSGGKTPLLLAVEKKLIWAVEDLLNAGADPDLESPISGLTPLSSAIRCEPQLINPTGSPTNQSAAENIVGLLLKNKASLDLKDNDGLTLLHIAASFGTASVIKKLIEAGMDHAAVDNDGNTPLHLGARLNTLDSVKVFVDSGANVEAVNRKGMRPLCFAVENSREVTQLLLDADANPEINCEDASQNGNSVRFSLLDKAIASKKQCEQCAQLVKAKLESRQLAQGIPKKEDGVEKKGPGRRSI